MADKRWLIVDLRGGKCGEHKPLNPFECGSTRREDLPDHERRPVCRQQVVELGKTWKKAPACRPCVHHASIRSMIFLVRHFPERPSQFLVSALQAILDFIHLRNFLLINMS